MSQSVCGPQRTTSGDRPTSQLTWDRVSKKGGAACQCVWKTNWLQHILLPPPPVSQQECCKCRLLWLPCWGFEQRFIFLLAESFNHCAEFPDIYFILYRNAFFLVVLHGIFYGDGDQSLALVLYCKDLLKQAQQCTPAIPVSLETEAGEHKDLGWLEQHIVRSCL